MFFTGTIFMQLLMINGDLECSMEKVALNTSFAREFILLLLWLVLPGAGFHYSAMRLEIELFIANYKTEKEKTNLETII